MATYLIGREIPITRQEGDNADIVIQVPVELSLAGDVSLRFQVTDKKDTYVVFEKNIGNGATIAGQVITIILLPEDTTGFNGVFKWELEVTKASDYGIVTIGRGDFKIIKQIIE